MKMHKDKKAQTEIFGLAIVVVMLSFGMVLILAYGGEAVPDKLKLLNKEIAKKFINTLLETTTDCEGRTIQTLIKDVASYYPTGNIDCGGMTSGEYLTQNLGLIANETLSFWFEKKGYEFVIYVDGVEEDVIFSQSLLRCKAKTGDEFPTPDDGKVIITRLDICA